MQIGVGISVYTKFMTECSNNHRRLKGFKVARLRQMDKACWNLIKYRCAEMEAEDGNT